MTTPSFSVSRMDPICWSHCGFSLLNTLSFCRTAAIEKTYARELTASLTLLSSPQNELAQECGHYSRLRAERRSKFAFESGQTPCGEGKCIASTKARRASEPAELIDLLRDNKSKERFFRSRCQRGTAAFAVACPFSGTQESVDFGIARSEGAVRVGYAERRTIPSLRILCWRVDRFIPRCAAAPLWPATTQLHCSRALRICSRSDCSRTS